MPIPADKLHKLPDAELDCLRCGARNKSLGLIRLAETAFPGDSLGALVRGLLEGLELEAQICPQCGKLELFS